ncbi:MAG: 2-C-methyl-D-erythritol 4-phosphate cytidylyltransferase [Dehalococcoidia bacterium]|nr:2-C-methyl-D-erythritol 4-phosphate cytidylyltransferase [Dehalococcoidia bacterium]
MRKEKTGAIVVAAGKSRRMEGTDKVFADLGGKPLLARVISTLQECNCVDQIVVVVSQENLGRGQQLQDKYNWSKVSGFCLGGERRQDSVREGLKRLIGCDWVVIHDGGRPLVSVDLIERGLVEAKGTGAAIAAVPAKDTIKVATADGFVQSTLRRETLWVVQTPQVFRFALIEQAHHQIREDVTDDAMMVEQLGHRVRIYMGSYENIKVTTPDDLALAEMIVRNREL